MKRPKFVPNIIKYRVLRDHSSSISTEHFESETDKFLVRHGTTRVIKNGVDYLYFDTWEEARAHSLTLARHELRVATMRVVHIQALTPGKP